MATSRESLAKFGTHVDESLGKRGNTTRPILAPMPNAKDAGRKPSRDVGRVDIEKVIPDPEQPRTEFSSDAIQRLADSIREKGQLAPITVRWSDTHGKWIIIAGERRWRATRHAGLPTIECRFYENELPRSEILQQQMIENCLREDLTPIEEADAYTKLMELNGWTGKQVAEALRVTPAKVSRAIALLKLPPEIRQDVATGRIAPRTAYELSKLNNRAAQQNLARQAAAGRLDHLQAAKAARRQKGRGGHSKPRGTKQTFVVDGGWKVIVSSGKTGNYFDIEQALTNALEDVRHRIANNVQLF